MAKRNPAKGMFNATGVGAVAGAIHGGLTNEMGGTATIRPDHLFGNPGEVIAGSQTLAEGMNHIATSTGYGALGAAAAVGALHLGVKAYDAIQKNRNLGRQFD